MTRIRSRAAGSFLSVMSCWAIITILWGGYGILIDQTRPKPGWSTCSFDSVSGLTLPQSINPFGQHLASFVCKWMNLPHLTVSISSSYRIFHHLVTISDRINSPPGTYPNLSPHRHGRGSCKRTKTRPATHNAYKSWFNQSIAVNKVGLVHSGPLHRTWLGNELGYSERWISLHYSVTTRTTDDIGKVNQIGQDRKVR